MRKQVKKKRGDNDYRKKTKKSTEVMNKDTKEQMCLVMHALPAMRLAAAVTISLS